MLDAYCPHRRAPLFYGRNEECGLRCVYHGWKFDASGTCVDMPSEPPESDFKDRLTIKAYPTYEVGGLVWVYMGPPDKQPARPPLLEWTELPASSAACRSSGSTKTTTCRASRATSTPPTSASCTRTIGPSRRCPDTTARSARGNLFRVADSHPRLTAMDTDYGMVYGGRRRACPTDSYYWRVTQWLLPSFSLIPGRGRRGGTAWIPVDDEHCVRYSIGLSPDAGHRYGGGRGALTQRASRSSSRSSDGTIIDTMIPYGTKANQYEIDRAMQKAGHYTGIWSIAMQDKAMIEGMTRTVDRSLEHLGSSDIAVIAARRRLIKLARDLEKGIEPVAPTHPELYRVRPLDLVSSEAEFGPLLEQHSEDARVPVAAGAGR